MSQDSPPPVSRSRFSSFTSFLSKIGAPVTWLAHKVRTLGKGSTTDTEVKAVDQRAQQVLKEKEILPPPRPLVGESKSLEEDSMHPSPTEQLKVKFGQIKAKIEEAKQKIKEGSPRDFGAVVDELYKLEEGLDTLFSETENQGIETKLSEDQAGVLLEMSEMSDILEINDVNEKIKAKIEEANQKIKGESAKDFEDVLAELSELKKEFDGVLKKEVAIKFPFPGQAEIEEGLAEILKKGPQAYSKHHIDKVVGLIRGKVAEAEAKVQGKSAEDFRAVLKELSNLKTQLEDRLKGQDKAAKILSEEQQKVVGELDRILAGNAYVIGTTVRDMQEKIKEIKLKKNTGSFEDFKGALTRLKSDVAALTVYLEGGDKSKILTMSQLEVVEEAERIQMRGQAAYDIANVYDIDGIVGIIQKKIEEFKQKTESGSLKEISKCLDELEGLNSGQWGRLEGQNVTKILSQEQKNVISEMKRIFDKDWPRFTIEHKAMTIRGQIEKAQQKLLAGTIQEFQDALRALESPYADLNQLVKGSLGEEYLSVEKLKNSFTEMERSVQIKIDNTTTKMLEQLKVIGEQANAPGAVFEAALADYSTLKGELNKLLETEKKLNVFLRNREEPDRAYIQNFNNVFTELSALIDKLSAFPQYSEIREKFGLDVKTIKNAIIIHYQEKIDDAENSYEDAIMAFNSKINERAKRATDPTFRKIHWLKEVETCYQKFAERTENFEKILRLVEQDCPKEIPMKSRLELRRGIIRRKQGFPDFTEECRVLMHKLLSGETLSSEEKKRALSVPPLEVLQAAREVASVDPAKLKESLSTEFEGAASFLSSLAEGKSPEGRVYDPNSLQQILRRDDFVGKIRKTLQRAYEEYIACGQHVGDDSLLLTRAHTLLGVLKPQTLQQISELKPKEVKKRRTILSEATERASTFLSNLEKGVDLSNMPYDPATIGAIRLGGGPTFEIWRSLQKAFIKYNTMMPYDYKNLDGATEILEQLSSESLRKILDGDRAKKISEQRSPESLEKKTIEGPRSVSLAKPGGLLQRISALFRRKG